jgi:hypothetical protein
VVLTLAQGDYQHVPFRDSKLTRILKDSLTVRGVEVGGQMKLMGTVAVLTGLLLLGTVAVLRLVCC